MLAAALPLLLTAGCGDGDDAPLTVSAAASLQEPLTRCAGDATRLQFARFAFGAMMPSVAVWSAL